MSDKSRFGCSLNASIAFARRFGRVRFTENVVKMGGWATSAECHARGRLKRPARCRGALGAAGELLGAAREPLDKAGFMRIIWEK